MQAVPGEKPLPGSALNHTTTFAYDPAGNRTKRTDAKGQATTYSYCDYCFVAIPVPA